MENGLPKNWVETDFGSIIKFKNGYAFKSKDLRDEGIPVIRIGNIKDGRIDLSNTLRINEELINKNFVINKGDILIAMSGATTGKYGIYDYDEIVLQNQRVGNIKPHSEDLISKKFVYYLLGVLKEEIEDLAYGGAQPNISSSRIEALKIQLPPLPEQNRIVTKLDRLFAQLEGINGSMDKIPDLLKNFRQQVLTQAVTGKLTEEWRKNKNIGKWRTFTLGKLINGNPKNGAYYPRSLYGEGTRIIRIDCFYEGKLKFWNKVQKVQIPESDKTIYGLNENNILINRVNSIDYLGKCMLVEGLPEECVFESNMMRIEINEEKVAPKYLRLFLTSQIGLRELRKNAKHAVNQASINQQDVKAVEVQLPDKKEQEEILNRVELLLEKTGFLEKQYEDLKNKINNLPQALLHKAFKGELVPQLESDGDARELLEEIQELKRKEKFLIR